MDSAVNTSFSPSSSFESLLSSDIDSGVSFPEHPSPSPRWNKMVGPSPCSPRFFSFPDDGGDGARHFLDSCHLCKRPLGGGRDIYMYRGDTPFCSEECRQEQIEMDEAGERRSVMAQKQKAKNSKSPPKSEKIKVRVSGTVVAG